MSITLNPEQETIVDNLIATGSFQTAEQVMQVALKLLEQERQSYQSWVIETREKSVKALSPSIGVKESMAKPS